MANAATRSTAALVLVATLPLMAACAAPESSTADNSDDLPVFSWTPLPRMRPPSTERPAWLPSLPADLPRFPVPSDGFRA